MASVELENLGLPRQRGLPALPQLSRQLEKLALSARELAEARRQVDTDPSEAQREAGNYAKGHVTWNGLGIAIENPKGSTRSGVNKEGKAWSVTMKNDYGYIKGYKGADKDQVDVFLGPDLDSELVFIIDQNDPTTGKFDECKCIVGTTSESQARKLYEDNFNKGWTGFRQATALTLPQFKWWLEHGNKAKPVTQGAFAKKSADAIKAPAEHVRQETNYTCGPSSEKAVFDLVEDEEIPEETLADEVKAGPEKGTEPKDLVTVAREHGFQTELAEDLTTDQLKNLLDEGIPVICGIQAWGDPEDYDELESGHYVVAIGYDEDNIYFEDPSIDGETRGYLPVEEFEDRWKDREHNGKSYHHLGIPLFKPELPEPEDEDVDDAEKISDDRPYRDRVEVFGLDPRGKVLGGYYDKDKNHGVFGGGVDPGETPEQAAAREFQEEAGYRLNNPRLLPVQPATFEWAPPYATPQQAERAKQFRGSRTFYATGDLGDVVPEEERGTDQRSGLQSIRLRSLATALRQTRLNRAYSRPGAIGRREALRHLMTEITARMAKQGTAKCPGCGKPFPEGEPLPDVECCEVCERYGPPKEAGDARGRGIPDRRNYGDLAKLPPNELADFIIQLHEAQRAGRHFDYRIGSPSLGLYSWASRHELPEPGKRRAFYQQPLHSHAYGSFQGTLSGYGAGTVRTHRKGQVLITKATPGKIEFTTADERYPQRYAMIKPQTFKDQDWLLINTTPRQGVPYMKEHMVSIPKEEVEGRLKQLAQGDSVQAKIDGAASLIQLLKDGVEVISYRTSKVTGRPILHTERVFRGRPRMPIPPELVGTVLKGELYGIRDDAAGVAGGDQVGPGQDGEGAGQRQPLAGGLVPPGHRSVPRDAAQAAAPAEEVDDLGLAQADQAAAEGPAAAAQALAGAPGGADQAPGRVRAGGDGGLGQRRHGTGTEGGAGVIGPQELGGLLNASLGESLAQQKKQGVKLRVMLHGIQQLGKRHIDPNVVPYSERMDLIRSAVMPHLPADVFHEAESATDPEGALKLWQQISAGTHPLTREGIVIHPATGKPMKSKLLEEQDVHITGTFPGEGKYAGRGVGGFTYATTPGGPTAGKVGTGLTDQLRLDAYSHPELYAGRVARVRSHGPFASGALRAPALIALHEDYPTTEEKAAVDLATLRELGIVKTADDEEAHVPTVAVDFDGTIAEEEKPFDPDSAGPPRKGVRKWLKKFRDAGARIIIFTVRGDRGFVADYMEEHNLPYDYINENPEQPEDSSGKVIADVYWDDRAISAKGPVSESAPTVLDRLKAADDTYLLVYRDPADVLAVVHLMQNAQAT